MYFFGPKLNMLQKSRYKEIMSMLQTVKENFEGNIVENTNRDTKRN